MLGIFLLATLLGSSGPMPPSIGGNVVMVDKLTVPAAAIVDGFMLDDTGVSPVRAGSTIAMLDLMMIAETPDLDIREVLQQTKVHWSALGAIGPDAIAMPDSWEALLVVPASAAGQEIEIGCDVDLQGVTKSMSLRIPVTP